MSNNSQFQNLSQTNGQLKKSKLHLALKPWQWVSVLAVAAVIVLLFLLFHRPPMSPQVQREITPSISQINQNAHLYRDKLISVQGKIVMSEMTYSGVPPEPGGRRWEVFLQSEDTSIALNIDKFTQNYNSFQEHYNQKEVKVKARVRQEDEYNPFLELEDIRVVQQLTITTDKTEYEQGETVRITVKNNTDKILYYGGSGGVEKQQGDERVLIETLWECPCEVKCETEFQHLQLQPQESREFSWDQSRESCQKLKTIKEQVEAGKYRLAVEYFLINGERREKYTYSNEFRIKKPKEVGLHKLTLHVKLLFPPPDEEPLPLPIEVSIFRMQNGKKDESPFIEKSVSRDPENLQEGIVVFELPKGDYICEAVPSKLPAEGSLDVSLHSDLERDIILYTIEIE